MKNVEKIANIIVLLLLAVTLVTTFIFWRFPLNYLSYKTGYKVETINNLLEYRHERLNFSQSELEKACNGFNSEVIMNAYGGLYGASIFLIGFSLIAIILFALALRFSKQNTFRLSNKFAILYMSILFVSFFMFISMDFKEWI